MTNKTITIQCRDSARTVPVVWAGDCLAVHRPIKNGAPSTAPRCWTLTHSPSGLAIVSSLTVAKNDAVALAKAWDSAAALIDPAKPSAWRFLQAWKDDLQRVGIVPVWGPRDFPESERAAVWRAMGYEPAADDEAAEQYPAEITRQTTGAGAVRRNAESGELEFWWLPRGGNYCDADAITLAGWYPVPCLADVEAWALDSVAETPCGDSVEPDHPDAWPRLLGVI
jgi:hypothetical protein